MFTVIFTQAYKLSTQDHAINLTA